MEPWWTVDGSPRGYWIIQGDDWFGPAVASNARNRKIREETKGRFRLVGNVTQSDCSLRIDDVRRSDGGSYYFRYEHGGYSSIGYSYAQFPVRLTVVGLRDQPEISLPQGVMEGETVTVECTAPGRCSGTAPKITWSAESQFVYHQSSRNTDDSDGTRTYRSTITFTASRDQNNKRLTCSVFFPAVGASSHRSVWLNVEYAPAAPEIIQYDTEDWSGKQENVSTKIRMERRNINMHCSVDSSPPANLTWIKGGETKLEKVANNKLTLRLSNVTFKDEGQYWCIAKNIHGVANSSVFISVLGVSTGVTTGIVVASFLLLVLLVGVSLCVTRKIWKRSNTGNRNMNMASNDTTVDPTYQELQRRQSDTYSELKRDGK
ncbi:sialic acid-binding Ig-like lectin 8 [Lissotriton helveticus]